MPLGNTPFKRALLAITATAISQLNAQTLYWDTNGATAGSSNIRQTWDINTWWSTSAAGDVATQGWVSGATSVFSAGNNATGTYIVDVGTNLFTPSIFVEEGDITFFGGATSGSFLDLSSIDVASGASATLNVTQNETSGSPINFTKSGAGTLTILTDGININTTGSTTVSGGTLNLGNLTQLSDGSVTVSNGATLNASLALPINRTVSLTGIGSNLSFSGDLEIGTNGIGILNVQNGAVMDKSSNDTYIGLNQNFVGTLNVSGADAVVSTNDLFVGYDGDGTLNIDSGGRVDVGNELYVGIYPGLLAVDATGSGVVNLNEGGILSIGGLDTISGGFDSAINLNGGTIEVSGSNLQTNWIFNLIEGSTSYIDTNGLTASLNFSPVGAGGLGKTGAGTMIVSTPYTYTGDTIISQGTLQFSGNGSVPGNIVNNAELLLNSSATNFTNDISGTGSVKVNGSGSPVLSGNNSYSGGTTLSGGSLTFGTAANIGSGPVTVTAGTLTATSGFDFKNDVTVSGASGFGISSGTTAIGNTTGGATLNLSGGATMVPKGSIVLAFENGETGTATVTGAGTLLWGGGSPSSVNTPILGEMTLGFRGTGVLNITDNAVVRVPRINFGVFEGSSGTLNLNQGTLQLYQNNGIIQNTAGATINAENGTIEIISQVNAMGNKDFNFTPTVNIAADSSYTVTGNGRNVTHSGVIAGEGNLILGNSINYLNAANTFSGTTTLIAGTTHLGNSLALQNSTLLSPSRIFFANVNSATFGGIAGSENLDLSNFFAAVSLFIGNNNEDTNYSGNISAAGAITKIGTGTLTLSGVNTHIYTGIHSGTLQLGNNSSLGGINGTVSLDGGNLDLGTFSPTIETVIFNGGTFTNGTFDNASAFEVRSGSLSNALGGTAGLTKTGAGTFVLSGTNSYASGTTLNDGILQIATDSALGAIPASATPGNLNFNGGTLATTASFTLNANRGIDFDTAGGTFTTAISTTLSVDGNVAGNGSLTKSGAGTLLLNGTNTYSGSTAVDAGTLALGSASALGSTSSVDIASGATLELNDFSVSIGDLDGAGNIALGSATLTTGDADAHTLSGTISGGGSITKTDSGTLTLSGVNTYTGGTTVSAGTLAVSTDSHLGNTSGNVTLTNGATLSTGSSFATNRSISATGGSLTNSNDLTIGSSGTGSLSLASGSSATAYNLNAGYGTSSNGTIHIGSGSTANVTNATTVGWNASDIGNLTVTGTNSTLTNGGTYYLGWFGDGTTAISNGGKISTTGFAFASNAGSAGTLNLNTGGILETKSLSAGAGSTTFNLAGGTLRSTAAFASSIPATLTNASTIDTNGYATTLSGVLSGSGSLTKTGSNTLTLTGTNTYAGGTTINAGTLAVTNAAQLGTGDIAVANGGVLTNASRFESASSRNITIDGSGSSFQTSSDLWFDRAASTTTSVSVTNGGNLSTEATFSLGDQAGSVGTLTVDGVGSTASSSGIFYLGYIGNGTATVANGGILTSGGQLDLASAYAGSSATVNLNSGGTLRVGGTDGIKTGAGSAVINGNGGTLKVIGSDLSTDVAFSLDAASNSTINTNSLNASLSGNISGTGSLTKTGTGALTVIAASSFSGGTLINAGSILLANTTGSALGTGDVTVATGGTLGGNGSIDGALFVQGGGTFAPGSSPGLVTIGRGSELAGFLNIEIGGTVRGTEYDAIDVNGDGTMTLGGILNISFINDFAPIASDSFQLFENGSIIGSFDTVNLPTLTTGLDWNTTALYTEGRLGVLAVPEPSAFAFIIGAVSLLYTNRRRRRI